MERIPSPAAATSRAGIGALGGRCRDASTRKGTAAPRRKAASETFHQSAENAQRRCLPSRKSLSGGQNFCNNFLCAGRQKVLLQVRVPLPPFPGCPTTRAGQDKVRVHPAVENYREGCATVLRGDVGDCAKMAPKWRQGLLRSRERRFGCERVVLEHAHVVLLNLPIDFVLKRALSLHKA